MSLIELDAITVEPKKSFWRSAKDTVKNANLTELSLQFEAKKRYGITGSIASGYQEIAGVLVNLVPVMNGQLLFEGQAVLHQTGKQLLAYQQHVQFLFTDAVGSLNPSHRVLDSIAGPMRSFEQMSDTEERHRVLDLMGVVSLPIDLLEAYPSDLSGEQAVRVGVARAIAASPKVIVAEEPLASLDQGSGRRILALLEKLQKEMDLTLIYVTRNEEILKKRCDLVYIIDQGHLLVSGQPSELKTTLDQVLLTNTQEVGR